ncbi:MAG TPA: hypothetical protein HPP83_07195, partial [Candidatus Hydrogenedentes bacterium]|nr:hypothetical protein [Candidatus Hydrogenedentota bacterium]
MDCPEVRDEFSALLDGELDLARRSAVEAHLAKCSDCLRELDRLKRVDRVYRELPKQAAPAGFEHRVRASLRSSRLRLRPVGLRRRAVWPLAAAAAMFLLL